MEETTRATAMQALLAPRSIAIVGASSSTSKFGGLLLPVLRAGGYAGSVFPINPAHENLDGLRCYPSLAEVPEPIDHAIVILPGDAVGDTLRECRRLGVGAASVFASGFSELDLDRGKQAEEGLRQAAGGMPFLGPNCMGFANLGTGLIAAHAPSLLRNPEVGGLSIVSQSGGMAFASLCFLAREAGVSVNYVVSTGNTAGVDLAELVGYVAEDEDTRVVLLVLESNELVARVLERIAGEQVSCPVILLKLGRSKTGVAMARSHTGSLAGDYRALRDCAQQLGVVCVDDIPHALHVSAMMLGGFKPSDCGGLAGVSISGGNLTLFADAVEAAGLPLVGLEADTTAKLSAVLPPYISAKNPVDLTVFGIGHPELHEQVIEILAADPAVDVIVPILTSVNDYRPVCELLADVTRRETGARLAVVWNGGSYDDGEALGLLHDAEIPVLPSAHALAAALDSLRRADAVPHESGDATPWATRSGLDAGPGSLTPLDEADSLRRLQEAGVAVAPWRLVGKAMVAQAAASVGYPVVIKTNSTETHISDRAGVILGVRNEQDLEARAAEIAALDGDEVLVVRFLEGLELIGGAFVHPLLGPLLLLGAGGRLAEVIEDVRFVRLPAPRVRIARTLAETTLGGALKAGARGMVGFDDAVNVLAGLGELLCRDPAIAQIEVNPFLVGAHGAAVADASITVRRG